MKKEHINGLLSDFEGVKTKKLLSHGNFNVTLISIEKGTELPTHVADSDAVVLVVEGKVIFTIEGKEHELGLNDMYEFSKDVPHSLKALENSKILLTK